MPQSVTSVIEPTTQLNLTECPDTLKDRMLAAKKLRELHALIIDYTDQEIKETYNRLTPEQQNRLNAICQRESCHYLP